MSGRAQAILARFPAHMEAGRPGKQLGHVAAALARDLDVQSAALARIRRAHRVGEADELRDLLLLAGLHGIGRAELAVLLLRFERGRALLAALGQAGDGAAREAAAEALLALWGLDAAPPRLDLFAPDPPEEDADRALAAERLTAHAGPALAERALLEAARRRVIEACALHAGGNGTVQAVMLAAANALDLEIGTIVHSTDRFWHASRVRDRQRLTRPVPGDAEASEEVGQASELLGLEENPLERTESDRIGRRHGELFDLRRRGFDRALLQVRVTGEGARTIGPMVVNRDEGHGVGFAGKVPAGATLVFTEEGRAQLNGADVTPFAYAWRGACFAGADASAERDFVFDGEGVGPRQKPARFAVATPANRLDSGTTFPHAGASLPMPGIAVGETRFAFFVQEAHASLATPMGVRRVVPRPAVGFLDGSVFAPGPDESREVAAQVGLSWLEHRAYAVRLLVPGRFKELDPDDPEAAVVRQHVVRALRRFRPAGVEVAVAFVDERWVLGHGVLGGEDDDPIAALRSGMVLWSQPSPPPSG